MPSLTQEQEKYVNDAVGMVPFVTFNYDTGRYEITENDLSWNQVQLLGPFVNKLRNTPPPGPAFTQLRLDEFVTSYHDRCLEHYCYQRLNLNVPHDQTCWIKYAEKTECLGKIDRDKKFSDEGKSHFLESLGKKTEDGVYRSVYRAYCKDPNIKRYLKKDPDGWVIFYADIPYESGVLTKRIREYKDRVIQALSRKPVEDRVLGIVNSIMTKGWSSELARKPSGSVIGYSTTTKKYLVLTGRHRLAALKYLYSQGKMDGSTIIDFPIITYPWKTWLRGIPYPDNPVCEQCIQ